MIMLLYLAAAIGIVGSVIAGLVYIVLGIRKFEFMQQIITKNKKIGWLISLLPFLVTAVFVRINPVNTFIAVFHLIVFWILCEIAGIIIKKITHKEWRFRYDYMAAILITVIYLSVGWYTAHHVVETDYTLSTNKNVENLRVAQISDSHLGATFDGKGFAKHLETIQKTNPDIVVITGDFVDDDSSKKDMLEATKALGKMKTTYGIYFVYGNHDKGYYDAKDFTTKELEEAFIKNHVMILNDEAVTINQDFILVGRQDAQTSENRKSALEVMEGIDTKNKYVIMLDHEPTDYDNEAKTNVDLVLSGHTHGGQMFPIGITGELSGANDRTYGLEKRKNTTFIVNSGISDWAIKFKTGGAISEFGIIDIKTK